MRPHLVLLASFIPVQQRILANFLLDKARTQIPQRGAQRWVAGLRSFLSWLPGIGEVVTIEVLLFD